MWNIDTTKKRKLRWLAGMFTATLALLGLGYLTADVEIGDGSGWNLGTWLVAASFIVFAVSPAVMDSLKNK